MTSLAAALLIALQPPEPACIVHVKNSDAVERSELVSVAVPLPRGRRAAVHGVRLGSFGGAAIPTIRWPDGSVAVALVRAPVTVPAGRELHLPVSWTDIAAPAPPHLELPMPRSVLTDPWGRRFEAAFVGPGEAMDHDGPFVRARRYRALHTGEGGLLPVELWVETFAGERRARWTLILDNVPRPGEPVFGPVRLQAWSLVVPDAGLRMLPRHAAALSVPPPSPVDGGGFEQPLLPESELHYLGDRTAKAIRFDLVLDDGSEGVAAARRAVERPLTAFCDLEWVRTTGAFSLHGGPAAGSADPVDWGRVVVANWSERQGSFGPFAAFGDELEPARTALGRVAPFALHNALRWRSSALLKLGELGALQQTLRPAPAAFPREPEDTAAWRSGLGAIARSRPHGWAPLDYEHFAVDLLYDWYWLTGDPIALRELRRLGDGLIRLLEDLPFFTSRGEGLCLRSAVAISRATQRPSLLQRVLERFRSDVVPTITRTDGRASLPQPGHERVLGLEVAFVSPWQTALLVHGLHAAWRVTGDAELATLAVELTRTIATDGWLEGTGPKAAFSARDPRSYLMPVDHRADEGTGWVCLGAFVLAGEMANSATDLELFRRRADLLTTGHRESPTEDGAISNPWFQLEFDRRPPTSRR